jgi:hypothetical protein
VTAGESSNNNPMWTWVFECVEEPYVGRKMWVHTTLTEKAMWKLAEVFAAFGVGTDTDTDILLGRLARIEVSQRVIGAGARAGQMGNNADRVLPEKDEPIDPAAIKANGNGTGNAKADKAAEAAKIDF